MKLQLPIFSILLTESDGRRAHSLPPIRKFIARNKAIKTNNIEKNFQNKSYLQFYFVLLLGKQQ